MAAPSAMLGDRTLLVATGVSKSYAARVLDNVSFDLHSGEVHALVGENGAGKSTLSRIIAGITPADEGTLALHGQPYAPRNRKDAEHQGVRMVMQELNLVANLTVAESIFIDRLPHRFGWIDYRRLNADAHRVLEDIGLGRLDPARPIRTLGVGQQQLVEIAAGLAGFCENASEGRATRVLDSSNTPRGHGLAGPLPPAATATAPVLILDEPTAALTDPEIELLFAQIARLKATGAGIVYISHRMEEIRRIADRISVLRDGRMVATRATPDITLEEIIRLMVGRDLGNAIHREPKPPGPLALRVTGLSRGTAVREVSFDARRGEILGFGGLMGSGRTETMRVIFGADRPDAGQIFLHGSSRPARLHSPRDAVRQGIALMTEDRKQHGLFLPLTVRANITLARLRGLAGLGGWIRAGEERGAAVRWVNALSVRCESSEQPVAELSGGNQQKVVIARWLFRDCDILIFDEPTRGIDVGAKFEIYHLLVELADKGKAVIVVSSDLKELLALCDRIVVMSAGKVAGTFARGEWTQDQIMAAALSEHLKAGAGVA